MGRYTMAHRTIQDMKSQGLVKFVYSRSMPPEGYVKVNDNLFTVYMPPEISKKEAYDSLLVDQLMDISRSLNIDAQRFVSLGRRRAWGLAYEEGAPERVRTKAFGPESVLIHEIGHVLGFRYKLYDMLGRRKEGRWTTIKTGKKAGEAKFVPDKDAVEHRRKIDVQWRALADARFKSKKVTPAFQNYVRKAAEKEAVLLEAFLHAPDEFKRVAPELLKQFKTFLNSHIELRPLLDVKPSLVLGESEAVIKIPGFTVLGHYYAPEKAARILNNYLSPGLRSSEYKAISAPYNATRFVGNLINMAQLSFSGFHAFNVSTDMMASTLGQGIRSLTSKGQFLQGVGQIAQSPVAPLMRLWDGTRLRQAYGKQLNTIKNPKLRDLVEALVLAGGRDRMDTFYYNQGFKALQMTVSQIFRGSPMKKVEGMMKLPLDLFTTTLEGLAYPIMGWYVPTGKLGIFSMMADHEMQRLKNGEINEEQLWERLTSSWDSTENRMGQLTYDNLFWNKTLKDASMLAVRSVGWNLGSWREFPGSLVDTVMTGERLDRGDKVISQKMAYVGSAVILYATLGATIMYMLTGEGPTEPKDYFFPKTGRKNPDGSAERISLPTYAKDWYAWAYRPVETARNKLHPIWTAMGDLAKNKDFFNVLIRDESDPLLQQGVDMVKHFSKNFKSFSLRNYEKMQKVAPWEQTKNALVSITGITSAPAYITRSNAQKLAYRYIIERIPDTPITSEEFEMRMYKKTIKDGMRKATLPMEEYTKAKQVLGSKVIRRMEKEITKTPFAVLFNRLSYREALNVYTISNEQEKSEAKKLLIKKHGKYKNNRKTTPEMNQMYHELMRPIEPIKRKPGIRPRVKQ